MLSHYNIIFTLSRYVLVILGTSCSKQVLFLPAFGLKNEIQISVYLFIYGLVGFLVFEKEERGGGRLGGSWLCELVFLSKNVNIDERTGWFLRYKLRNNVLGNVIKIKNELTFHSSIFSFHREVGYKLITNISCQNLTEKYLLTNLLNNLNKVLKILTNFLIIRFIQQLFYLF